MNAIKLRCLSLSVMWLFGFSFYSGQIWAQPNMMTREQAASILQQILHVGQYPGTLDWTTVANLPAQQEVHLFDSRLQNQLLEQGKSPVHTMTVYPPTWWKAPSPFDDAYVFFVDHNHLSDTDAIPDIWVNAWTGLTLIDLPTALSGKTNTQRGLGHLTPLTFEQQRARALEIVRTLYGDGEYLFRLEVYDQLPDPPYEKYDNAEFGSEFLIYKIDPQTGARLLTRASMLINSRTGGLEAGRFYNRPVTISTKPTYTETQARQIALNYLQKRGVSFREWLHGYQGYKRVGDVIFAGYVDEGLFVEEDGLLEQHLVWMFPYSYTTSHGEIFAGFVGVNAHTGSIIPDFTLSMEAHKWERKHWRKLPEHQISLILVNGDMVELWEPLRLKNGRLYIWAEYVDNLGGRWDGHQIFGEKGIIKITPTECLRRGQYIYLPLAKVCQALGIRLWWDNHRKRLKLRVEWLEAKRLLTKQTQR